MQRKQLQHAHDHGLAHDLARLTDLVGRRRMLGWMAGASLVPLIGCPRSDSGVSSSGGAGASGETPDGSAANSCVTIPEETQGPYPGDGSNGANALILSGIVRRDIRSSLAGATGVAEGVPLSVRLKLKNSADGCTALEGYAVYLWHCDREGRYSMYTLPNENYLRGVQETDADGSVEFQTIFPGCYSGRMPHMHFEIYPSLNSANAAGNKIKTSQLAFPRDVCDVVYATAGYETSVGNFSRISFESDNVFSDGVDSQLATVTGDADSGYVASLDVNIAD